MELDSAPKKGVPLMKLRKEGTQCHYLNSEYHGTFFEALALFFEENREDVERVIMHMQDKPDAPPQAEARKAARLVRWLVEMANKLPVCGLDDPKYHAGHSLINRDIAMTREQVLVLIANLVLLRLDGGKNPMHQYLKQEAFPFQENPEWYKLGCNMEPLYSDWPEGVNENAEKRRGEPWSTAVRSKVIVIVHALEQLRQCYEQKAKKASDLTEQEQESEWANRYMEKIISFHLAKYKDVQEDLEEVSDIKSFGNYKGNFLIHPHPMVGPQVVKECKDADLPLPNCLLNFANANHLTGAITRSATQECILAATMMELYVSMLYLGELPDNSAVVCKGMAMSTCSYDGLNKTFKTYLTYAEHTQEGREGAIAKQRDDAPLSMKRRSTEEEPDMFSMKCRKTMPEYTHPIVISAPATEIGKRIQRGDHSTVECRDGDVFKNGFEAQRTADFQRLLAGVKKAKDLLHPLQLVMSSGKWGGGIYNNNIVFKALQQYVVAGLLGVTILFSTFEIRSRIEKKETPQLDALELMQLFLEEGRWDDAIKEMMIQTLMTWKIKDVTHAAIQDLGRPACVKRLQELITGDTSDGKSNEDTILIDQAATKIFIDRMKTYPERSPDCDNHMEMVVTIASILWKRQEYYFPVIA